MIMFKAGGTHHFLTRLQSGMTIVELIVGIAVSGILLSVIVGMFMAFIQQYSVTTVRNNMNTDIQAALNRISDDARNSSNALLYNDASDDNAPSTLVGEYANVPGPDVNPDYKHNWRMGPNRLILAQPTRDASGNPIYTDSDNAIGPRNSVIYYVKSGTLYRRLVAGAGNVQATATCTVVADGGCNVAPNDKDLKIISGLATDDGVGSFTVKYYNNNGIEIKNTVPTCTAWGDGTCMTPGPDAPDYSGFPATRLVSVEIKLKKTTTSQTVTTSNTVKMQFRKDVVIKAAEDTKPFPVSVAAGSGGIYLDNNSGILGYNVAIKGNVSVTYNSYIGSTTQPVTTSIANIACGNSTNYPIACSTDPIDLYWYSHIYGTICTNGQTKTSWSLGSSILPGNGGQGLVQPCTVAPIAMPTFDKAAFAAKMTNTATAASQSCDMGNKVTQLAANTKYTGNFDMYWYCTGEIQGDIYVDGTFKLRNNSTLKVAESVTKRPIIVVNGFTRLYWYSKILPNSRGIAPYIISYESSDSACTHSDSCTSLSTAAKRYNSRNMSGIEVSYSSTAPSAYLSAPFSTLDMFWYMQLGGLSGERINMDFDAVITLDQ